MEISKEKVLDIIEEFKKEAWDDYCSTNILNTNKKRYLLGVMDTCEEIKNAIRRLQYEEEEKQAKKDSGEVVASRPH